MNLSSHLLLSTLAAAVLHESAHIMCASMLGVKVKRVGINWRGLYIARDSGVPLQNLAISLAGPMANLACTGLIFLAGWVGTWVISFALVSLLLRIYNLLPLPNTDGRRALALLKVSVR